MERSALPPRFFLRFFRWFCHPDLCDSIEGDLVELYRERLKESGKVKADWKFVSDVLLLFRPGIIRSMKRSYYFNQYGMFRNYFKIALRNLQKSKAYSMINIVGLATGMSVTLLIGLWIWDELSFDGYHENRARLAQVLLTQSNEDENYTGGTISMPLGDALRTKYAADLKAVSLVSWNSDHTLTVGDKKLSGRGMWVQRDFPEMFTLKMISGRRDALKDPSTLLLNQSLAKSLFGDADPLNKTVRVDNRFDMTVGGVYEDLPHNTTFYNTKLFLPWDNKANWMNAETGWQNHCGELFVQLSDHADFAGVTEKIKNVPTPYFEKWHEEIMLQPLARLHLYDKFENGKEAGGRIEFVWLFGIIGAFVLLLACINFMNLSTARSEKRAKEVGIRKTVGSLRAQLVGQFLSESIIVASMAFVLCLILTQSFLPFFNQIADKQISIQWGNPVFWSLLIGFTLITGIVSGSYPAFYLSAFKPAKVLKGAFKAGRLALIPRRVLVVIQFTVSVTLIIGTVIIFLQIQYAKDRPAGYSRNGLISLFMNTPELEKSYDVLRNELLQTGAVENMARSSESAVHFSSNNSVDWQGKDPDFVIFFRNVNVTTEFGKTIGWTIKEGRDFSQELPTDSSAVIINETAAKTIGFKNTIGETVTFREKKYTIIGIVKDMITQSPYDPAAPSIFFREGWTGFITIRIKPDMPVREALARIGAVFKKYNPSAPFDYQFVDVGYARKFSDEERIGSLATFFASLAIFISCLGLFGLASFVAEQRTKEIGIRKVLGASVANLWQMLSKDFVKLVFVSLLIAIPVAYYFMDQWLQNYEYRVNMSWWVFAGSGAGLIVITLLTVSFQAIKAAVANPVRSLRSE